MISHLKATSFKVIHSENGTIQKRPPKEVNFGEKVGMKNILPLHVPHLPNYAIIDWFYAKVPFWVPFPYKFFSLHKGGNLDIFQKGSQFIIHSLIYKVEIVHIKSFPLLIIDIMNIIFSPCSVTPYSFNIARFVWIIGASPTHLSL